MDMQNCARSGISNLRTEAIRNLLKTLLCNIDQPVNNAESVIELASLVCKSRPRLSAAQEHAFRPKAL
ncbi:hypothetical protein KM043_010269 [Ampulex compressa]|nr:hypothetical protein KM043_010269 [Ampulex compressa]